MDGGSVWFPLLGLVLGALILWGIVVVSRRGAGGGGAGGGGGAERRLRAAAGDAAAERLIRFEQSRAPELSRAAAAERAYDRLIADRTR